MSKQAASAWHEVSVTLLTGWRGRLADAIRLRGFPLEAIGDDGLRTTAVIRTTRTVDEVEDELRAQLQFSGWMAVEEIDYEA